MLVVGVGVDDDDAAAVRGRSNINDRLIGIIRGLVFVVLLVVESSFMVGYLFVLLFFNETWIRIIIYKKEENGWACCLNEYGVCVYCWEVRIEVGTSFSNMFWKIKV